MLRKVFESLFDFVEVGEILGVVLDFGILNDAFFIDDEGRAFGDSAHDEVRFRKKLFVSDTVSFCDFVLVVGEEGEGNALFLSPNSLSEGIISRDTDYNGVEAIVFREFFGDCAKLVSADASKGHGNKEEDDVFFANFFREGEEFGAFRAFGDEGEIRG